MPADVVLVVGGQPHYGWKEVDIDRSIENGAWSFELIMTQRWSTTAEVPINKDQKVELFLGDELLITGWIDSVEETIGAKEHGIRVVGRSTTADLIDCSIEGREFKNLTMKQIAAQLCQPFSIGIVDDVKDNTPFKLVRIASGQPIYEFLEGLARIRAARLVPTPNGNLAIIRAEKKVAATALVLGKNIEKITRVDSQESQFSEYTVLAQQTEALFSVDDNVIPHATVKNSHVKRHRPTVVQSDNPADIAGCRARAEWMRNTQFGRSQPIHITTSTWEQSEGKPSWPLNYLVDISASDMGLAGSRLLTRSRLRKDKDGTRCELSLMPAEAFDLVPLPEPQASGGLF